MVINQAEMIEARNLLPLLRTETVQAVRALIADRREVRLSFDCLIARRRRRGKGFRKNVDTKAVSMELRNEIGRLLRLGWSHKRILATLNCGPWIIYRIARRIRASYFKHGRGRRFSPEQMDKMRAAIKSGKTSVTIEREFHIDPHTVWKLRCELGDREDRRRRKKLSAQQIASATEALKSGREWRDVARDIGVSDTTLYRCLRYRKHGPRRERAT
jgi:hypothetical protein